MNATSAPANPLSLVFKVLLLVGGAFAIYYSYQALFASELSSITFVTDVMAANMSKPLTFPRAKLPRLYEGGEFAMSGWIYVNNWTGTRANYNKEVLSIGNHSAAGGKITLGIYLDSTQNMLHVKTSNVADCSPGTGSAAATGNSCLTYATYNALFTSPSIGTVGNLGNMTGGDCSVTPFELQKWVHFAVVLNGKTVDVYLDGKLARSCVNNGIFAVDAATGDVTLQICSNGGFGGYVAGIKGYDFALNPEQVYRSYMAGPMSDVPLSDYLKSLFDPKAIGTLEYPKMN
jgi:hypothetical protein